jgi:predicted Zn-dependent peptidase
MQFKQEILSNGLVLIGEINPSAKSAAVGYFVRTGARDETLEVNGVSHYLEHMLFKGSDKLSALEVNEAFDKRGAEANAGTGEEATVYYASALPEYLVEITELWAELMRPALRDDDFNIEKDVIKQEIAMHQDMPTADVLDRCRSLHFDTHPCGYSVLGSVESIDRLTAEQMREYFVQRYAPNNMVVAFTGNVDWNGVCAVVEEACGQWPPQNVGRKLVHVEGTKRKTRTRKPNLNREHACLMHTGVSAQDPRRFAAWLLGVIIGDDHGSRFYWELVNKALVDEATMFSSYMDGTGAFYSLIECAGQNSPRVLEIVDAVFRDVYEKGVAEDELERARNKTLSSMVVRNELPMGRLDHLGSNWLYLGDYRSIEDDVNAIKAVTAREINALAREIDVTSYTRYSLGSEPVS